MKEHDHTKRGENAFTLSTPINIWSSLETTTYAVPSIWRERTGPQFPTFKAAFLQARAQPAQYFPCRKCGCSHAVTIHAPNDIVALCTCEPWICDDLILTHADIELLELNWSKLGRALCKAFGLNARSADLALPKTRQIGAWSADGVPVILTLQPERHSFQRIVIALTARLGQQFILLAPTSDNLDAVSQEMLIKAKTRFFGLDAQLVLTEDGELEARTAPGQLWSSFAGGLTVHRNTTPAPKTVKAPLAFPYSLRKGFGVWKLTFDGKEAELKHEQGILYVAWLLANPPSQPIHALDLAAKIPALEAAQSGTTQMLDPADGHVGPLLSDARIQQRSLGLEDAQTLRALLRKQKELEAILDSEDESEPVKAEALRDLEAIAEFQRNHGHRSQDSAQRAVRSVRMAISRFYQHLVRTVDAAGKPHPVLRPFAAHLQKHLLIPSSRYAGLKASRAREGLFGCFTYEPPPGVTWQW